MSEHKDYVKQIAKQQKTFRRAAKDAAIQAKLDSFLALCPYCGTNSQWSMQLSKQSQADLLCPQCGKNIATAILFCALITQRRRLLQFLLITAFIAVAAITLCLLLPLFGANSFRSMSFGLVLLFSAAAILAALALAVIIVLLKRLLFMRKQMRKIKDLTGQ